MHILFLVLSTLGAAAFWWYRLKYLRQAGSEAMDAIGRAQGKIRRNKIRKQAEGSPVTAIDHPVIAAATLLSTVIADPSLTPAQQDLVKQEFSPSATKNRLLKRWFMPNGLAIKRLIPAKPQQGCAPNFKSG